MKEASGGTRVMPQFVVWTIRQGEPPLTAKTGSRHRGKSRLGAGQRVGRWVSCELNFVLREYDMAVGHPKSGVQQKELIMNSRQWQGMYRLAYVEPCDIFIAVGTTKLFLFQVKSPSEDHESKDKTLSTITALIGINRYYLLDYSKRKPLWKAFSI